MRRGGWQRRRAARRGRSAGRGLRRSGLWHSGLRRRLAVSFGLVAVLAVVLTAALLLGAGGRALRALDPALASAFALGPGSGGPEALSETQRQLLGTVFAGFARGAWTAVTISGLLALLASALLARQLVRPLTRLEAAATRVAAGERGVRLPLPPRDDELRRVTSAFNTLAQNLERQEAWRRSLVADVAHDLRTPLAVLRAEIEAMQDGVISPDAGGLGRLHGEVLLLSRLVDDLRTLSLAEGGALTLRPRTLEAGETLRRLAALYAGRAAEAGCPLRLSVPEGPLPLRADPDRLMQILHNLLDNALRYAGPGEVELGAAPDGDSVRLWVRDHGPGFPPDALSRAFERFYRADASRGRDPQGRASSGLGLAIARALAEAQGGTLEAQNAEVQNVEVQNVEVQGGAANMGAGGAVFTLRLPAA